MKEGDNMNNSNTVQIHYGAEGIKNVYRDSLNEESLDIVCLSKNYKDVLGDFFDKEYAPKLYAKVKTREITELPNSQANESDMLISQNKVVLISFGKSAPMAVVITDTELVRGFQNQFNALWAKLK